MIIAKIDGTDLDDLVLRTEPRIIPDYGKEEARADFERRRLAGKEWFRDKMIEIYKVPYPDLHQGILGQIGFINKQSELRRTGAAR